MATFNQDHIYETPAKLISNVDEMRLWERSQAYYEYLGFIMSVNNAIKGKSNLKDGESCSEPVKKMHEVLNKLDEMMTENPPIQQPQRFGNQAFKTWHQQLKDNSMVLLQSVLPERLYKAIPEIIMYFVDGFGNATRIDYGTGHEIAFLMFLCALFKIGVYTAADEIGIGCYVFPRYLDLARKLQKVYRMEPAGSHGVWSLDDYQFVPFIWGSSQLYSHPIIEPSSFLKHEILESYSEQYMFLKCIQYIISVKTGPFAEHSNQLWSISGVSSWSKINGGLIKMYKAEVLNKFPVIQHIVFGSLFTLKGVEQSFGLMIPKTSMIGPPAPSIKSSKSSSKSSQSKSESSKSLVEEEKPSVATIEDSTQSIETKEDSVAP